MRFWGLATLLADGQEDAAGLARRLWGAAATGGER
jgi:hypothetical protein